MSFLRTTMPTPAAWIGLLILVVFAAGWFIPARSAQPPDRAGVVVSIDDEDYFYISYQLTLEQARSGQYRSMTYAEAVGQGRVPAPHTDISVKGPPLWIHLWIIATEGAPYWQWNADGSSVGMRANVESPESPSPNKNEAAS